MRQRLMTEISQNVNRVLRYSGCPGFKIILCYCLFYLTVVESIFVCTVARWADNIAAIAGRAWMKLAYDEHRKREGDALQWAKSSCG